MYISVVDQHRANKNVYQCTEPLEVCIRVVDQHRATKDVYQSC